MRNVLEQLKNKFSNLCDINFLRYGYFLLKIGQFLFNIEFKVGHNSKNKDGKNLKNDFYSIQYCAHLSCKYGHF